MEGAVVLYALWGTILGILLGWMILIFEQFSKRRVKIATQLAWFITLTVLGFGTISHIEIRFRHIAPVFLADTIVFGTSFLTAIFASQPRKAA